MDDKDFYDEAAKVETKRLNESAKRLGCEPPKEFSDMFETALANDLRKTADRRRKQIADANSRDEDRLLLRRGK